MGSRVELAAELGEGPLDGLTRGVGRVGGGADGVLDDELAMVDAGGEVVSSACGYVLRVSTRTTPSSPTIAPICWSQKR